jgi:hypothetical protein
MMSGNISKLVDDSLKFGTAIPDNMKPMIEAEIKAGQLFDANGKKITDLTGIKFEATPLDTGLATLDDTLKKLIDALTGPNGITAAFAKINGTTLNPKDLTVNVHANVDPNLAYFNAHSGDPAYMAAGAAARADWMVWNDSGRVGPEPQVPWGFSQGGMVTSDMQAFAGGGRVLQFTPRGTDTVPAMLTPGERVLSVAETQQSGQAVPLKLMIAGRVLAQVMLPLHAEELRRPRLA